LTGYISPKRLFLKEPHGVTSQKTAFFMVTAAKTSNLTVIQSFLNVNMKPVIGIAVVSQNPGTSEIELDFQNDE
jgi:hypothetical protein